MPLPDIQSRPSDAIELKTMYESGGAYDGDTITAGGDIDTQKTAARNDAVAVIDAIETEIGTDKATAISNFQAILETYKSQWPFANQAAFESSVDGLKTSVAGTINADINQNWSAREAAAEDAIDNNITGGGGTVPIADALQQVYEDYSALVQAEALTYPCPQCATTGLAPIYDTTGTTIVREITCPLCDGYAYTDIAYKRNPNGTGYVPV